MADQDEIAAALGSPEFRAAWDAVMTGTELAALPDDQRAAVARAREATGTRGPGLPMPMGVDPTRPVFQAPHGGGDDIA